MNAWDIWNKAIPLSKAPLRFAHKEKKQEFLKLQSDSSVLSMLERAQKNMDAGAVGWEALAGVSGSSSAYRALDNQLKANTVSGIKQGLVRAFGFSAPRKVDDVPSEVPADLWDRVISWDKDRIDGNALKMEGIRLIPTQWIKPRSEASIEEPRLAGRPSRKAQIVAGFNALREEEKIDFSRPASRCYPAIRQWVQSNYPDDEKSDKGLGDKAMQKYANPLFNEHRPAAYKL